jgi:diaminohydroxyphosphoribosylaminopyrimidine deaminase/5-amino-6-(5-phosphoribosylamino)uracil reductase
MHTVIDLAKQGTGFVSPNPLVGALIVKHSTVIGKGFHQRYGSCHAELNAIFSAQESLEGSTLYTNLEPCCHTNKNTPPCAQRIIQEKIVRVVIANRDPNPYVNGKGIAVLKEAGIEVIEGVCAEEGERLNEVFFTFQRKKRPFVHLKYAQTLDGKIACLNGDSKWITHENARKKVHEMRLQYDAILIGVGTLIADNPSLTIRLIASQKKCSWRIILGSLKYVDLNHTVVSDEFCHKTIIVTHHKDYTIHRTQVETLSQCGVVIISVDGSDEGMLNLDQVMQALTKKNITSVLVEGGSAIICSFLKERLVDRVSIFIAPKIIGTGIDAVQELGVTRMADALTFVHCEYEMIDEIVCMSAVPNFRNTPCLPV